MNNHTSVKKKSLLERLDRDLVICAEGYLFELERRGYLKSGAYVPEVVLDFPDAVKQLHREFMRAGSEVVLALTYYAHRDKMKVIGRERDVEKLNRQAVRLAREVADEGDALVAGNISNTWVYNPKEHEASSKLVRAMYEEQVGWAVDEGVDFIVAETLDHFGEAVIALDVIKSFGLPAVVMLIPVTPKTGDDYTFVKACKILADRGADVVGLNCGRGPQTILPLLKKIVKSVDAHIAALPVAYRTTSSNPAFIDLKFKGCTHGFPIELDPFVLTRYQMAEFAVEAKAIGVRYVGVCCGGAPHHVRAMAEALGREVPASRYSPDLGLHAMLGAEEVVKGHTKEIYEEEIKQIRNS